MDDFIGPTMSSENRNMINKIILGMTGTGKFYNPLDSLGNCKNCNELHSIMENEERNFNAFISKESLQLCCSKCRRTTPYETVSEIRDS